MSYQTHLTFNTHLGRQKPETIRNADTSCPFCNVDHLTDIIDQEDSIILLMNKFQTLNNTVQTVLIETDECESELSLYPRPHLHKLIRFGMEHWQQMKESGKFKSVIFYKNHGPLSGGTIRHPHMQIVGLEHLDYMAHVHPSHFDGVLVAEQKGAEFNVSTTPRVGFTEFNILLNHLDDVDIMADFLQTAAHFSLNHFHSRCNSYNVFFYEIENRIAVKVVPRFVTSPLYVGFSIPQVLDSVEETAQKIRNLYFSN